MQGRARAPRPAPPPHLHRRVGGVSESAGRAGSHVGQRHSCPQQMCFLRLSTPKKLFWVWNAQDLWETMWSGKRKLWKSFWCKRHWESGLRENSSFSLRNAFSAESPSDLIHSFFKKSPGWWTTLKEKQKETPVLPTLCFGWCSHGSGLLAFSFKANLLPPSRSI